MLGAWQVSAGLGLLTVLYPVVAIERAATDVRWICFAVSLLSITYALYSYVTEPNVMTSKNSFSNNTPHFRAMRKKLFFPGYSNGWHAICNAEDLTNGKIKSISALGTQMVAFRGQNGKVGVLHAFCPHLGAHLGQGGKIEGDLIVCPFHNWSFDCTGTCKEIPYMRTNDGTIPERTSIKSYPVREILGIILVWFHAEKEFANAPQYEPDVARDLQDNINNNTWYYAGMRRAEFEMHSCEMAMNSADQHHFDTLHSPFPIPIMQNFVTGVHKIHCKYETGILGGKVVEKKEYALFNEKTKGLYLFGNEKFPLPGSEWSSSMVDTNVVFEGPTIIHFIIDTPLGQIRQIMTLLSVEPFFQHVESRWYAQRSEIGS